MRYTLPRRRVALIMAAILLSGCYEGAGPVGPVKPAASLLPLRLVSSTPIQGEKRAPLFGDITFTLSEDLVASSISSETVQLSPSAAGVGHSGHSLGPGAVNALGGTLISLLGSDNTANLVDQVITPGATIMGQVRLNNDERTVVFTPNNQLMSGMTYTIALHGVDTGSMNPMLAPIVAPSAGARGSAPAAWATEITTGTIMFAEAVFDVTSERAAAITVEPMSSAVSPLDGIQASSDRPMASASPV